MSKNSNDNGRAYEFVWIQTLYNALKQLRTTEVINNSSLEANKKAWSMLSEDMKRILEVSADAAIETILELEPCMTEDDGDILTLEFQKDENGVKGDVRDIVVKRDNIKWEIGLSIKHNHDAVKHCRMSYKLDFGENWYDVPCSQNYWNAVTPIFDQLISYRQEGLKWSELEDKELSVYIPLLNAFMDEIRLCYANNPSILWKMIEYLIGVDDYYKIVSIDSKRLTMIHAFNIHNTLNMASKVKVSAISVPVTDLPTDLIAMRFKPNSNNTIEMYLNNGWQLGFRLHNARTLVEPSLKFDIQFIGVPVSILNLECKWQKQM